MAKAPPQALDTHGFHAVSPKRDCPHCTEENIAPKEAFEGVHVNDACPDCEHRGENWVCLKPECRTVRCSRYVQSHMVGHNTNNQDHPICFSFADFSFWCYACDSYVVHPLLNHTEAFYLQKFAEDQSAAEVLQQVRDSKAASEQIREEDEDEDEEEKKNEEGNSSAVDDLAAAVSGLSLEPAAEENKGFTYEELVAGLKDNKFKKIMVMTGAGVSVSAGIPDFRSPGTGIYDNLAEYNLPQPEAIFALEYFLDKPEPFYKFAQHFDLTNHNPTPTHFFIKMLQDKGILWKNPTQNIDNLEEKTGMDMSAVVQAHGANRGAHCARCKEKANFEALQQAIRDQNILRCSGCDSPVKPGIVFFGEGLPQEFFTVMQTCAKEVDLCIVMGTALAVSPFNILPTMLPKETPKVLFNLDNTKTTGGQDFTEPNTKKLFVQGKCDEMVRKLVDDCGWTQDFENVLPDYHKTSTT